MTPDINRLYAFTLGHCEMLVADIPEDQMRHQPSPGVNSPAWQIGHLVWASDLLATLLGAEAVLPASYAEQFGMGSDPSKLGDDCPSKDELMAALRDSHERLSAACPNADPQVLASPNPVELIQGPLPTLRDLAIHVMTTHEGMHLGHLSSWRRQMGKPPLF